MLLYTNIKYYRHCYIGKHPPQPIVEEPSERHWPKQNSEFVELFRTMSKEEFRANGQEKLHDIGKVPLSHLKSFKVLNLFKKLRIVISG